MNMKKPSRRKSVSSLSVSVPPPSPPLDLDLFSCHSHEQVHIYEKLCSSISSLCEIAYCSSEGIIICVPQTCQRQSSSALSSVSSSSSSLCPMLIARIAYPFESTDPANSSTGNSSSNVFFAQLNEKILPKLSKAYKHRPTSLSSFDRLLCSETIHSKGFRSCLFSPLDVTLNEGQSILATISCAHEVFIYDIIPSSKRFFHSQSSTLKVDLTERLRASPRLNEFLRDSDSEDDSRLLYFHLTSSILWNETGTHLFQLQSSGHLIVWNWDRSMNLSAIIDTKIVRSMSMIWNEEMKILIVIGKENQRVLVHLETSRVVKIETNENDFMNTEHAELLRWKDRTLVLIESKINYSFVSTIDIDDDQQKNASYLCQLSDYRLLPSTIVGFQRQQLSPLSILIGCEDGTMHSLVLSRQSPLNVVEMKLVASGQIKSSSRKPLLLRHFKLSVNQCLLARIFYSPIVAPNVKFGFVLCALHRWSSTESAEKLVDSFLARNDIPLCRSSDELALIFNEIRRGKIVDYQAKKNTSDSLQRACRLFAMLDNKKQLQTLEQQFLEIYRSKLSSVLQSLFAKTLPKLSPIESLIYSVCCQKDQPSFSSTFFLCPLCNAALVMDTNDLRMASCSNKHLWPRCSRTLLPLALEVAETCSLCDRSITSIGTNEKTSANFLKHKEKDLSFFFSSLCTYCLGIH